MGEGRWAWFGPGKKPHFFRLYEDQIFSGISGFLGLCKDGSRRGRYPLAGDQRSKRPEELPGDRCDGGGRRSQVRVADRFGLRQSVAAADCEHRQGHAPGRPRGRPHAIVRAAILAEPNLAVEIANAATALLPNQSDAILKVAVAAAPADLKDQIGEAPATADTTDNLGESKASGGSPASPSFPSQPVQPDLVSPSS